MMTFTVETCSDSVTSFIYYYIDVVVYWRYIIYCTIVIAQRDGFRQYIYIYIYIYIYTYRIYRKAACVAAGGGIFENQL